MNNTRYLVVSERSRWTIIQRGRRFPEAYASKTQAVCSAIALAERDGHSGMHAEVLVRHEDGHFITEWIFGKEAHPETSARPTVLPQ